MAAKLFEIEMQITCTNVFKKNNSYVCKLLSPCHGPKKTCGVGGHPTRSGVNTVLTWLFLSILGIFSQNGPAASEDISIEAGCIVILTTSTIPKMRPMSLQFVGISEQLRTFDYPKQSPKEFKKSQGVQNNKTDQKNKKGVKWTKYVVN